MYMIKYLADSIDTFSGSSRMLKPSNVKGDTELLSATALTMRFGLFGGWHWQFNYVASYPKETLNVCANGDYYPMMNSTSHIRLRPLAIFDETGHRMTEQEVRDLVRSYSVRKFSYHTPVPEYQYRCDPVPFTGGSHNETKCRVRRNRNRYTAQPRSSYGDKCWKRTKCKRQWMKHIGLADPSQSIRISDPDDGLIEALCLELLPND